MNYNKSTKLYANPRNNPKSIPLTPNLKNWIISHNSKINTEYLKINPKALKILSFTSLIFLFSFYFWAVYTRTHPHTLKPRSCLSRSRIDIKVTPRRSSASDSLGTPDLAFKVTWPLSDHTSKGPQPSLKPKLKSTMLWGSIAGCVTGHLPTAFSGTTRKGATP